MGQMKKKQFFASCLHPKQGQNGQLVNFKPPYLPEKWVLSDFLASAWPSPVTWRYNSNSTGLIFFSHDSSERLWWFWRPLRTHFWTIVSAKLRFQKGILHSLTTIGWIYGLKCLHLAVEKHQQRRSQTSVEFFTSTKDKNATYMTKKSCKPLACDINELTAVAVIDVDDISVGCRCWLMLQKSRNFYQLVLAGHFFRAKIVFKNSIFV